MSPVDLSGQLSSGIKLDELWFLELWSNPALIPLKQWTWQACHQSFLEDQEADSGENLQMRWMETQCLCGHVGCREPTTTSRQMISSALFVHSLCELLHCTLCAQYSLCVNVFRCNMHGGAPVLTTRKQLRTLGSTLLPPKAATSPSWRGIWMASWSSRLR